MIESFVDHHAISNACTGTGRLKLRLGDGEDLDMVKLQLVQAGYSV